MSKQYNPFQQQETTVHADWWPDGWQVTVRSLTYIESQEVGQAVIKSGTRLGSGKNGRRANTDMTVDDMDLARMRLETMLRCIVSWTFEDGNGKTAPINRDYLSKLDAQSGDFIMSAIEELNPERDEAFQDIS